MNLLLTPFPAQLPLGWERVNGPGKLPRLASESTNLTWHLDSLALHWHWQPVKVEGLSLAGRGVLHTHKQIQGDLLPKQPVPWVRHSGIRCHPQSITSTTTSENGSMRVCSGTMCVSSDTTSRCSRLQHDPATRHQTCFQLRPNLWFRTQGFDDGGGVVIGVPIIAHSLDFSSVLILFSAA